MGRVRAKGVEREGRKAEERRKKRTSIWKRGGRKGRVNFVFWGGKKEKGRGKKGG